jgi:hypothetical protein
MKITNNLVLYTVSRGPAVSPSSPPLFKPAAGSAEHVKLPSDDAGLAEVRASMASAEAACRAALTSAAGMIQKSLLDFLS